MVLNFNSTNATIEQRLAFLQQTEELTKRTLYAAYSSPQNNIEETDIDAVFNSQHPTILTGDLNSKHLQWNSKTLNRKGKQLKTIVDERNLTVDAPTEDTHIHTPTGSTNVLDLVILKNVTTPYYLETINDLSSDHLSVIMTVSIESSNIEHTIGTTNWQKFEKSLKLRPTYISTDNDIDTACGISNYFAFEDSKVLVVARTSYITDCLQT
ncbi:hypothetical protein Trydic_g22546 [Trypoxylus dichotomus]